MRCALPAGFPHLPQPPSPPRVPRARTLSGHVLPLAAVCRLSPVSGLRARFPAPLLWWTPSSISRLVPRKGRRGSRVTARARRAGPRERGVASLEYLGMLPFLLLIALAGIQLGIAAYCGEQAGTAARTAARTAAEHSPHPDAAQAGRDAVSDWVHPDIQFTENGDTTVKVTATVHIPSVFPGVHLFDPVTRSATMPKEDATP
ncbi:pilus assembly protein [Streptomyces sp. PLK6-54]|uniref:Pilus assembly protein n=1 Tax=Actinacidiphila acidipaludis TaxID=2873382 RepID=A0ABS7Q1W2_9ACTN|nr:pilus assembly protein [Streptomyces acidipaludis]